ncbi:MAG: glycosyltransferase [Candidatus Omnitrophica bacterium]|nr:glycosyltransferase [Candidatus Omnitrophota bacterium]
MFKSVIIATHVFSPGTSQALRDYLIKERKDVLFIGHPLFGNLCTWSLSALDTLYQVIKTRKKFDLYVGSNNLNAFIGIILKKIGLIKKVIFFTPDYCLQRFKTKLLNKIYFWLDYYCIRNADLVWNSSSIMLVDLMVQEREKRGVPKKYRGKQISVPDGTDQVKQIPFSEINRYEIGFVGHLKEGMGLGLLIEAFPEIKKQIPEAKLLIIGSGPIEEKLRSKARGMDVEFTGFIGDISLVYQRLSKCAVAVAPYEKNTISEYTDPGKVKNYLSLGLPMVITKVPRVALEIEKERCGFAVDCNKDELIDAIVRLLKDEFLLKSYRENALKLAEKYRWDKIFKRALSYIENSCNFGIEKYDDI